MTDVQWLWLIMILIALTLLWRIGALSIRVERLEKEKENKPQIAALPHPLAHVDLAGIEFEQRRELVQQAIDAQGMPAVYLPSQDQKRGR